GTHTVSATWTPANSTAYASSQAQHALVVNRATTTTEISVSARDLRAAVAPVAPGAGTPTGEVTFRVDGTEVGTAILKDGTAELARNMSTGKSHTVSAEYAGDAQFSASSA